MTEAPRSGGTPAAMSESPSVAAWIRALPPDACAQIARAYYDAIEDARSTYDANTMDKRASQAFRDALLSLAPPEGENRGTRAAVEAIVQEVSFRARTGKSWGAEDVEVWTRQVQMATELRTSAPDYRCGICDEHATYLTENRWYCATHRPTPREQT